VAQPLRHAGKVWQNRVDGHMNRANTRAMRISALRWAALAAAFSLAAACGAGNKGSKTPDDSKKKTVTATGHPDDSLIPRKVFFSNPDKASPKLSPDGTKLAYLAPSGGVLNVWVGPVDDVSKAKPVTADKTRPVRSYTWSKSGKHILYSQDTGGDEDWHLYAVNLAAGTTTDLTPFKKVTARIESMSARHPSTVLVGINNRDKRLHDVWTINLDTGERKLLVQNPGFLGFAFDHDLQPRLAMTMLPTGGIGIMKREGDAWKPYDKIPHADMLTTNVLGFDNSGKYVYLADSRNRNTAALIKRELATKKDEVVAESPKADFAGIMAHPTTHEIEAVAFNYLKREWKVLNPAIKADLDALAKVSAGEVNVISRSHNDRKWAVAFTKDDGPVRYYLWDRDAKKASFLFTNRKALEDVKLAKMHPVVIKSRDGLDLVSYLTLPKGTDPDSNGRPDKAQAMVLLVHGGPWYRDSWGYNPLHQMFADRGYAVLSVNYRGSTGFGKAFTNAGDREWAAKMHNDLIDAVNWAVKEGVAKKDQVCIAGGSYGGYATLVGLTFTPDVFKCGVDIVGPSSIVTLLEAMPQYWKPAKALFKKRVGDWETPEGRKFLESRSPLTFVDKITKPLLIGQGANDPRVKKAEADQIVKAMKQRKIPVTYVLYPDEGHGFHRPPNNLSFFAVSEAFLSVHLGGKYQPFGAGEFKGTTMQIPEGANGIPGVQTILDQSKK
jgi:dipeptidyl aminopeptidase/acylaminoacyl peptidase